MSEQEKNHGIPPGADLKPESGRRPDWLRIRIAPGHGREETSALLSSLRLNTVCNGAKCPNMGECFHRRTATFLIMGNVCTRSCKFCAIGHPRDTEPLEADEPERVAEAAAKLGLKYAVITSVTRDDLPDGGADCFARTISAVKKRLPQTKVEVLTPDFKGDKTALYHVLDAGPDVFNHNIETVRRLSNQVRSKATYDRTLEILRNASEYSSGRIPVKSGIMAGLGESDAEIIETMQDLYNAGVRLLTIGQYLPPSLRHWPLDRYVHPDKFALWGRIAREMGFSAVASSPLVRSSYAADALAKAAEIPD